jgi:hypothetical protein
MKTSLKTLIFTSAIIFVFVGTAKTSSAATNISTIRENVKENVAKNQNVRNESLEAPEKSFADLATTSILNLENIDDRIRTRTQEEDSLQKDTSDIYSNLSDAEKSIDLASTTLAQMQSTEKVSASTTHAFAVKVVTYLDDSKNSLRAALQALMNSI